MSNDRRGLSCTAPVNSNLRLKQPKRFAVGVHGRQAHRLSRTGPRAFCADGTAKNILPAPVTHRLARQSKCVMPRSST